MCRARRSSRPARAAAADPPTGPLSTSSQPFGWSARDELAATPAEDNVVSHSALPQRFRRLVERLNTALAEADTPERLAARGAFRDMIRQVVVTPAEDRGRWIWR